MRFLSHVYQCMRKEAKRNRVEGKMRVLCPLPHSHDIIIRCNVIVIFFSVPPIYCLCLLPSFLPSTSTKCSLPPFLCLCYWVCRGQAFTPQLGFPSWESLTSSEHKLVQYFRPFIGCSNLLFLKKHCQIPQAAQNKEKGTPLFDSFDQES